LSLDVAGCPLTGAAVAWLPVMGVSSAASPAGPQQCRPGDAEQFVSEETGRVFVRHRGDLGGDRERRG
jgi:hypothetical protein